MKADRPLKNERIALKPFFLVVCLLILVFHPHPGQAQLVSKDTKEQVSYYDADEVTYQSNPDRVHLTRNVLFLIGETYLKAERLSFDRNANIAVAEGDVHILRRKERLRATRVVLNTLSQEAYFENATLYADPQELSDQVNLDREVLGITRAELAFEADRASRRNAIRQDLEVLRERYVSGTNLLEIERNASRRRELEMEISQVSRRYAQLLGRYSRTTFQPNLFLEGLQPDERERLESRREIVKNYVRNGRIKTTNYQGFENLPGYLALSAESIYQDSEGILYARRARVTPCRCAPEDLAVWGLSANEVRIEPEKYATLWGATTDVGGVPVAYVPYLKVPVKGRRESGFLLPSIYLSRSGQVTSIPYFQVLGDHADATLTVDSYSSRGTRFGGEFRAALSARSRITLTGEYIDDIKRVQKFDPDATREQIEAEFGENSVTAQRLTDDLLLPESSRWQTSGNLNLPYGNTAALKADWQIISDNQYLADFSIDQEAKADLFAPAQSAYRFLRQEMAAEYYGKKLGLSLRIQKPKDVLESRPERTPGKSPKVELAIYPFRLFDSRIFLDQTASWEQVDRDDPLAFIDLYQTVGMPPDDAPPSLDAETGTVSADRRGSAIRNQPDALRTANEPYISAQRLALQSRASLPLFANPFIRSTAALRGVSTAYIYDASYPYPRITARSSYVNYEVQTTSQVDFERVFLFESDSAQLHAKARLNPFANLSYLPRVYRDRDFPNFYDVFYSTDNTAPEQKITFGMSSRFSLIKKAFQKSTKPLNRLLRKEKPSIGNTTLLKQLLSTGDSARQFSGEQLFDASRKTDFDSVLLKWAQLELEDYRELVLADEFGQILVWPTEPAYNLQTEWSATPFIFSLSTSYNFGSEETKNDIESRLNPGELTNEVDPWGDILLSSTINTRPFLPISIANSLSWSPLRKSFYMGTSSINVTFPIGLAIGYSNAFENYDTGSQTNRQVQTKRTIGYNATYRPRKWLLFTYQHKIPTDSLDVYTNEELRYESLQKITFAEIQDCLDIEIKRLKELSVIERNAEWSISLNLRFLGQERNFGNIGESINRSIQGRELSL